MTNPAISIVLPAYNRADTVRAAIGSVLRQTWSDFEVLIVDDGSTDDTLEVVKAETDPRIRVISLPRNLGPSAARNHGIAEARAEWVAFQDSDDEWLPEKLSRQMTRLREPDNNWIGAYCGMIIIGTAESDSDARPRIRYIPGPNIHKLEGDILLEVLRRSFISTQMLIVRRSLLQEVSGFDKNLLALEDWELMLRLAPLGPFAFVDEPLVLQRFSLNSITRDQSRRAQARRLITAKHHALLAAHPEILAQHYRITSGEYRQLDDISSARATLADWRKLRPMDLRAWMHTARIGFDALRK